MGEHGDFCISAARNTEAKGCTAMRDTIKNRAYFEEYLEVNEKRIERFQNQLQDLPVENIPGRQGCAAFIASLCRSRICALYSSGSDMNAIRDLCPQYVKYLAQAVKPQEGYFDVIDAVSLCTLLEAWECLPDLKTILQQTNMRNKLTDSLLFTLDSTWDVSDLDRRCAWFSEFLKCSSDKRAAYLKSYITKKWYRAHKDASWYDSHKSTANIYAGCWSFEVAAVAKIYSVPDSEKWPNYPYDLVHSV